MVRSAAEGLAVALSKVGTKCDPGMCLRYCRTWQGISPKWPDAITAWKNASGRHPRDATPPPGAPVFWQGGKHGHIAIYAGNGQIVSTDLPTSGRVGKVSINLPAQKWGRTYVGWAEGYNGAVIPGLEDDMTPPLPPKSDFQPGKRNASFTDMGKRFQVWLGDKISHDGNGYQPGPVYSKYDDENVRKVQAMMGDKPDPAGKAYLGPRQWERLFEAPPKPPTPPPALWTPKTTHTVKGLTYDYSGKPAGTLALPEGKYTRLDVPSFVPGRAGRVDWLLYANVVSKTAGKVRVRLVREAFKGEPADATAYADWPVVAGEVLVTQTYFEWVSATEAARPLHWELRPFGGPATVGTRYVKPSLLVVG